MMDASINTVLSRAVGSTCVSVLPVYYFIRSHLPLCIFVGYCAEFEKHLKTFELNYVGWGHDHTDDIDEF